MTLLTGSDWNAASERGPGVTVFGSCEIQSPLVGGVTVESASEGSNVYVYETGAAYASVPPYVTTTFRFASYAMARSVVFEIEDFVTSFVQFVPSQEYASSRTGEE